ncbi:hypothetical protein Hanom_Chr06g00515621 [Helianthus anomalus]
MNINTKGAYSQVFVDIIQSVRVCLLDQCQVTCMAERLMTYLVSTHLLSRHLYTTLINA